MGKLTDRVAKGIFWVLMEKFGIQAAHFVVTLVLARLLTPNDYGTVALISVFVSVSDVFIYCGLGTALTRKKNATQVDYNTVFYISLAMATSLYVVLFFAAPFIARFYDIAELCPMLRILALALIFHSINGVQNVELNRKMLFHLSFRISWVKVIVSSTIGIVLAFCGWGAWALVWASFWGAVTGVVARQLVIRWRPALMFSWASARELFSFGWKYVLASVISDLYQNLYVFVIGKLYTKADLAFVRKGGHPVRSMMAITTKTLKRVSFTALAKLQDDPVRLRGAMRKIINCSSLIAFPAISFCLVLAEPMVVALFGEQWRPAVPYLRLAACSAFFQPFNSVNVQVINATGRSDVYLRLVIFRRVVGLVIMACTIPFGILQFMIAGAFVMGPLSLIVYAWPNRKLLGYTIEMQLKDIFPMLLISLAMGLAVAPVLLLDVLPVVQLALAVPVALALHAGLTLAFRVRAVGYVAKIVEARAGGRNALLDRLLEFAERRCGE